MSATPKNLLRTRLESLECRTAPSGTGLTGGGRLTVTKEPVSINEPPAKLAAVREESPATADMATFSNSPVSWCVARPSVRVELMSRRSEQPAINEPLVRVELMTHRSELPAINEPLEEPGAISEPATLGASNGTSA